MILTEEQVRERISFLEKEFYLALSDFNRGQILIELSMLHSQLGDDE